MSYRLAARLRHLRAASLITALVCVHVAHTLMGVHAEALEQLLISMAATQD